MSLPLGTLLGQRYEIRAFIGSDGTLDVYKGLDLRLGRDVAMTVLELLSIHAPQELIDFEKEAQRRAALHHPRIITVHDFGHGGGCAFQVAEWLEGQSLRKRLKDGPLGWEETRRVAAAVLEGLAVIHRQGYTLQTMDPAAVFLQRDGQAKLFAYQLKSLTGAELLRAEKESLQALARTLLLILEDGAGLATPVENARVLPILRGWAEDKDLDGPALRQQFEDLVRFDAIKAPRPSRRRWLVKTFLILATVLLAGLSLRWFQIHQIQPPTPTIILKPPRDPEALRLYLQGMSLMETMEPDHLRRAQICLQNAITRDPANGLAHSGLGHCYSLMGLQRVLAKEEAQRLSEASTQRALALDPRLGEGHASLAFLKCWYAMNWPEAEREFRRALDLAPENARIQRDFGACLALLGRWPESLQHLKEALERDPLSQASRTSYAVYLHWAGRSEESLEEFAKAIDQDPTSRNTLRNYREVLEQLGRIEEALQVSDRLGILEAIPEHDAAALRTAFETRDLKGYRAERVRQAEALPDADPVRLAELVSLQGDRDRTFRLLGRALREKSLACARIPNSPALVLVRADPRFRHLLQRMGYPES